MTREQYHNAMGGDSTDDGWLRLQAAAAGANRAAPADLRIEMLRRSIRANIADMRLDPGAIAYDATLDPADVAQLDRIQTLADERAAALDQRDALAHQVRELETQRAVLERHLERSAMDAISWRNEALAERASTRRATYLAALLFCALCWREGWRAAKLAWGWL